MNPLTATERRCHLSEQYSYVCRRLFLHYHDYFVDGRWVLTTDINSNDDTALVRNKGDGLDDEECPEKETSPWEIQRSEFCYIYQGA